MHPFQEIKPEQLALNPFESLSKNWMLVTAPNGETANPMTASWGGFGVLWNKPVAYVFIRPSRFTKELVDKEETFSLAFLDERYREQYNLCGAKSGRDLDKIEACGFEVVKDGATPYITQAHTVLFCRKLYRQHMEIESFLSPELEQQIYGGANHHIVYVAEIKKILVRQ